MKLSKLIERLQELKDRNGDLSAFRGYMREGELMVIPTGIVNVTLEQGDSCMIVVIR